MQTEARHWPLGHVPIGIALLWGLGRALDALPGLSTAAAQVIFDVLMLLVADPRPQAALGERALGAHAHARGRLGPL